MKRKRERGDLQPTEVEIGGRIDVARLHSDDRKRGLLRRGLLLVPRFGPFIRGRCVRRIALEGLTEDLGVECKCVPRDEASRDDDSRAHGELNSRVNAKVQSFERGAKKKKRTI